MTRCASQNACRVLQSGAKRCIMSVGPFRSTLEPFREFILSKRRARLTWEEIAQAIREQGVACTRQAVQGYYKRQKNMRVPMGFESARPTLESTNRPNLKQAAAESRQIKKEKGKLDVVFANAGIAKYAALEEITEELYDSIFDINVKGLLFTVQKALPLLRDGAAIVLNASIVASKGLGSNSVYSATKAAVRSFARTWTTDLKSRRIRVNAVSPGPIDTPGLSQLLASSEVGQQRKEMISTGVPLGRLGTPDEIAKAVVFLASDDASYITGIELFVDGGIAQV